MVSLSDPRSPFLPQETRRSSSRTRPESVPENDPRTGERPVNHRTLPEVYHFSYSWRRKYQNTRLHTKGGDNKTSDNFRTKVHWVVSVEK